MNFLGIGVGEIILILIVLLVAVGPERLPELSRQAGRMMVRTRNWLQSSPDAALVMRARQELDQELEAIKSSLLEVQSVRDEVLDAARLLNDSVKPITSTRIGLDDLVGTPAAPDEGAPNGQTVPAAPIEATNLGEEAAELAPAAPGWAAPPPYAGPDYPPVEELEQLTFKLQAIMADLWALQEQLKQRGVLDLDWKPPSFTMQLPDQAATTDSHTEEVR